MPADSLGVADGEPPGCGLADPLGCAGSEPPPANTASSPNPFSITAMPTTTRATSTARRAGLRFTRAILPQRARPRPGSETNAQPPGHAPPSSRGADAMQSADQHRIVGERLRRLEHAVEQLVVPGRGESEALADGSLLGDLELPALALEVEERARSLVERTGRGVEGSASGNERSHRHRRCKHSLVPRARGSGGRTDDHTPRVRRRATGGTAAARRTCRSRLQGGGPPGRHGSHPLR